MGLSLDEEAQDWSRPLNRSSLVQGTCPQPAKTCGYGGTISSRSRLRATDFLFGLLHVLPSGQKTGCWCAIGAWYSLCGSHTREAAGEIPDPLVGRAAGLLRRKSNPARPTHSEKALLCRPQQKKT